MRLRSLSRAASSTVVAVPVPPPSRRRPRGQRACRRRCRPGRNSKERLRTSSAYRPPSAAQLMSSKKTPYMVSVIAGPVARRVDGDRVADLGGLAGRRRHQHRDEHRRQSGQQDKESPHDAHSPLLASRGAVRYFEHSSRSCNANDTKGDPLSRQTGRPSVT